MTPKPTDEQRQAIQSGHDQPAPVEDEQTHGRAMRALQEQEDLAAIQRGLNDRANGREQTFADVDVEIRKEFGFLPRSD